MVKYPLTGGLDLTTVKPLGLPGTLRECLNFEVATVDGYTRINGVARFDGSGSVGEYKIWRLRYPSGDTFTVGQRAWFDPALKGVVLDTAVEAGINVVYLLVPGSHTEPGLPATLASDTASASIFKRDVVFRGYGTQANFNAALKTVTDEQRDRVDPVPGRAGSDVIGGFWLKDRMYAIRDLPRISFSGGYYTDADEGKHVLIEGQSYKVLDVRITGDGFGILTFDTETSVGDMATPVGPAVFADLPVTGDYGPGYTFIPYSDDLDVSGGIAPYTWSLAGGDTEGTALDPIEPPDANSIEFLPQITSAALYRSSSSGWERVSLGREMAFEAGTSKIVNFPRDATLEDATVLDTGFVYPSVATVDGAANPNMGADDSTIAAVTGGDTCEYQATGFDFSAVPANAVVVGLEVEIDHVGTGVFDALVDLIGVATANKAAGPWPSTADTKVYGGSSDLWSSGRITAPLVRNADFGVRVVAKRLDAGTAMTGGIDFIRAKVYYVERDKPMYVWNGTSDVEMTLRHTQILSGDALTGSAKGYMNVDAPVNADKNRLVDVGDEIRSGPNGTGDLWGKVAARDVPIWMSGQSELDNNRARYQFERTNFFGQDEFEAVFGVSGAGPAFSFDGTRCIRIRSTLPPESDLPRHIARHGDMLVLGFFAGAIVLTPPGRPFETRGEEGATGIEVGDRLTALVPLAGDALGIVCQSLTQVLRGITPEAAVKSPISAKRGGIEYTAVDMGRIVLCDGLGIFLADSPESFGPAERSYMSMKVHPWLAPRLQASTNGESVYLRPVAALNVRNKNQMRLYFWDGWCLTMTMNDPVEFTTQRYYTPATSEHAEPTPWVPRMLASGIDSAGRERLFCSFYGGVKEGYVFEMDTGRSLDGEPIPYHATMNPLIVEASSREKRFDRYHLYGAGLGHASLTASRSMNDAEEFTGAFSLNFGRADNRARLTQAPLRGVVDTPIEAFDVSLRLESESDSDGPFTIQYVEMVVDDRGQSRGRQG